MLERSGILVGESVPAIVISLEWRRAADRREPGTADRPDLPDLAVQRAAQRLDHPAARAEPGFGMAGIGDPGQLPRQRQAGVLEAAAGAQERRAGPQAVPHGLAGWLLVPGGGGRAEPDF